MLFLFGIPTIAISQNNCIIDICNQDECGPVFVSYSPFGQNVFCEGGQVTLANTSNTQDFNLFIIDWGDGNVDTINHYDNISHVFNFPNLDRCAEGPIYNQFFCYTGFKSCMNGFSCNWQSGVISIALKPVAGFTSLDTICSGQTPNFINTSCNDDSILWDFGDGNTSSLENPQHQYDNPGTYIISQTVFNQCGTDILQKTITVLPSVGSSIDAGRDTLLCVRDSFYQLTPNMQGGVWQGPGLDDTLAGQINLYDASHGTNTYTYTFSAGTICESADSVTIEVVDYSNMKAGGNRTFCERPGTFAFSNFSPFGGVWSGAGLIDTLTGQINPALLDLDSTYRYFYCFTDQRINCQFCDSVDIRFNSKPQVDISITNACQGDSVIILNNSTGQTSNSTVLINFGDANNYTGDVQNEYYHTYSSSGTFLVTFRIANAPNCFDEIQDTVKAYPTPQPVIQGLASKYCFNAAIDTLSGTPLGGIFSGPGVSNTANPNDGIGFFNPVGQVNGTPIQYMFVDSNGCEGITTQIVDEIFPATIPDVIGLDTFFCLDSGLDTFTFNPDNGYIRPSSLITDSLAVGNQYVFNPNQPGNIPFEYVFTDGNGCVNQYTHTVTVGSLPSVDLGADTFLISGQDITLFGPDGNYAYQWSNGQSGREITISNPGFYVLTAIDLDNGCESSDTIFVDIRTGIYDLPFNNITVYPNPVKDIFTLSISGEIRGQEELIIFDLFGTIQKRKILANNGNSIEVNISDLSSGMYFLRVGKSVLKIEKI